MSTDRVTRVHQPAFLQNVSTGFRAPGMIADRVAPRVPVKKQSDKYRVWGKNMFQNRKGGTKWAPGTVPNAIGFRWSDDTYFAEGHKLRIPLLHAERNNADSDIQLRSKYTEVVTNGLAIAREARIVDLFCTAANYSGSNTVAKAGGSEWDTVLAATPTSAVVFTDIETGIREVKKDAMVASSELSIVIPDPVFDACIKQSAAFLERIKYSAMGIVTPDLLRAVFNVKEVIIASSMAVNGPEVDGADVLTGYTPSYLWGDNVWIGLLGTEGDTDMSPAFARTFNQTSETAGQPRQVSEYPMPDAGQEGDWIEVKEVVDEKLTFKDAGYLIRNTLASI